MLIPDGGQAAEVARAVGEATRAAGADPTVTYWVQFAVSMVGALFVAALGLLGYSRRVRRAEIKATAAFRAAEGAATKTTVDDLLRKVEACSTALAELRRSATTRPDVPVVINGITEAEVKDLLDRAVEAERRARVEAIELLRQEEAKIRAEISTAAHAGEQRWLEMHRSLGRIEGILSTYQES